MHAKTIDKQELKVTSLEGKISRNLKEINEILKNYKAKLIAVTKYYTQEAIIEAYNQGLRDFGESRAIEAKEKIESLNSDIRKKSEFHFIGHLQRNKVKKVIGTFNLIQSLDSIELAKEISKCASEQEIIQKVLIQVNNASEAQKFGIAPSQLNNFLNELSELKNIEVIGLMNIAPLSNDEKELRKLFKGMYELKEEFNLKELSMGMSNDYKIALDEGATMIRLGRAIFE